MGQWYMGRSGRFFQDPKEFRPERWLDEIDAKGPAGLTADDVLRPFSLGPRNCIGKLLALAEAKLVTAKLMWHFDMELDGAHDTWVEDARFYVSATFLIDQDDVDSLARPIVNRILTDYFHRSCGSYSR